jgi:hypothetical protein
LTTRAIKFLPCSFQLATAGQYNVPRANAILARRGRGWLARRRPPPVLFGYHGIALCYLLVPQPISYAAVVEAAPGNSIGTIYQGLDAMFSCHGPIGYTCSPNNEGACVMWRRAGPLDMSTAAVIMFAGLFIYSAWLTSIVFCSAHDERPLLIAAAAFFPVGVVHGIGVWFGGW